MNKVDKLLKFQKERDSLNEKIDKAFMIIFMEGYTLEEKRKASKEHKELIEEYKKLADLLK